MVVMTHEARERDVRGAIAEIDLHPTTRKPTRVIRVVRDLGV